MNTGGDDDLDFTIQIGDTQDQTKSLSSQQQEQMRNKNDNLLDFEDFNQQEKPQKQSSLQENQQQFSSKAQSQQYDAQNNNPVKNSLFNLDLSNASHPIACIFTFLFKGLALFSFLFLNMFFSHSIMIFILVIVFSAFDFWTIKNVTVGLRWWSQFREDGTELWIFESSDSLDKPNPTDSAFFWSTQIIACVAWGLITLYYLFSFHFFWAMLSGICLGLTTTNLLNFYKCKGEHHRKYDDMRSFVTSEGINIMSQQLFKNPFKK